MTRSNNNIDKVVLVGATHGNEVTGYHLLQKWQANRSLVERSSFETQMVVGNPKAFERKLRYIDKDLNRSFKNKELQDLSLEGYEQNRAKALNALLGPKGTDKTDVLIDLHTTTSTMGGTLMVTTSSPFKIRLAHHLRSTVDNIHVCCTDSGSSDRPFLGSIVERGMVFEVGPVENGVLRQDILDLTDAMVMAALDFIEAYNAGAPREEISYPVYQPIKIVPYPDVERPGAKPVISRDLQGYDYQELKPGMLMFVTLDGQEFRYEGPPGRYPMFVNEAAYQEDNVAYNECVLRQVTVTADDEVTLSD